MENISKAKKIKFIPDFEPDFQYEISIADFIPYKESIIGLKAPLKTGQTSPFFTLSASSGKWQDQLANFKSKENITLEDLIADKPLVISFHSNEWGEYGKLHLEVLERANSKIQGLGGNLLVISTESGDEIKKLVEKYDFSFSIVSDNLNEIATQFGTYSDLNPLWKRISGIEKNAPVAATFVVTQDQLIAYDFVNENLDNIFSVREALAAIYSTRSIKQSA